MLITNFASGELSENLFGRTDLRQYYNAAAKMENFDVIPTGGIKKRGGTEQVKKLDFGDGRIIPFVIDRKNAFLLYLTPKNILSYRLENGEAAAVKDHPKEGLRFYKTPEHIREVQYAQDFDTMILCHEEYPPLEVKLENGELTIIKLAIDNAVKITATNMTEEEVKQKYTDGIQDEKYAANGYLRSEGNYPRCGTFYNGRLIFAGTKNNPQMVFVSKVLTDDDKNKRTYPFATYDHFITKNKKYVSVLGAPNSDDTSVIILSDIYERFKFTDAELERYTVESPFYGKDVKIRELSGDRLRLSEPGLTIAPLTSSEKSVFTDLANGKIIKFENYNTIKTDKGKVGELSITLMATSQIYTSFITLKIGVSEYEIDGVTEYFDDDAASKLTADDLYNIIFWKVFNKLQDMQSAALKTYAEYRPLVHIAPFIDKIKEAADELDRRIQETMKYDFRTDTDYGRTYYKKPNDILAELELKFGSTKMYVTFYTEEYIPNSYPTPDCGFTFEIASDMNDSIRWLAVNKGLIIGTETAEWIVPPGVHATNIQAALNSRYGSDRIQGTAIGDATVFFQAGKKRLVEYYIPQADNNFRANDMAMLSPQMLNEKDAEAVEFDFISSPHTKLLITREDGTMAALLYERGTGTFAWSRINLGEGAIRSAAVLPGPDGNDDAYLLVERGSGWFLERLRDDGDVYLDGYTAADADNWAAELAAHAAGGLAPKVSRIYQEPHKITGEMETKYETLGVEAEPDWAKGGKFYLGYPYTSTLRTMPVIANDKMKKQRIVALLFRFLKSHGGLKMTALAGGRKIQTDPLTGVKPPHSGIYKQTFPGTWDEEVQAELTADEAAPVKILALNAEMAAGAY